MRKRLIVLFFDCLLRSFSNFNKQLEKHNNRSLSCHCGECLEFLKQKNKNSVKKFPEIKKNRRDIHYCLGLDNSIEFV